MTTKAVLPGKCRWAPCLAAFLVAACARPARRAAATAALPAGPRYAVLPFDDLTGDPAAGVVAREAVRIALFRKGYAMEDPAQVDALLAAALGATDPKTLKAVPARRLGAILGADHLVYGFVDRFGPAQPDDGKSGVELGLRIKGAPGGQDLFSRSAEADAAPIPSASAPLRAGQPALGHPLGPLAAAAAAECLEALPSAPGALADFGGPTADQIPPSETCLTLGSLHPWLAAWEGTEADPLPQEPVCRAPTGFPKVDAFLRDADAFTAEARLAAETAYLLKRGVAAASNGDAVSLLARTLSSDLGRPVEYAPTLMRRGQALIASTPRRASRKAAKRLAAVRAQLERMEKSLGPTLALAKAALAQLQAAYPAPSPAVEAPIAAAAEVPARAAAPRVVAPPPAAPKPAPAPAAVLTPPAPRVAASTVPLVLPDAYYEHLDLARGYDSVPDALKASQQYRAALAAAPGQLDAEIGLARDLFELRDYDGAEEFWTAVGRGLSKNDPRRAYMLEQLGATRIRRGDLVGAKGYYLMSIGFEKRLGLKDRNLLNAYLGLAYCLSREGQSKEAIHNYVKAYTLTRNDKTRAAIQGALDQLEGN